MERSELEELKINQLRNLAAGIPTIELTPFDTKETIIHKLLLDASVVKDEPNIEEEAITEAKPPVKAETSIEEVKAACNAFILRGMKLYHNAADNTWLMQIKLKPMMMRDTNTGEVRPVERYREDSGTLNQPLETIRRCARVLMSNVPTPKEVEIQHDRNKEYKAV